VALEGTIRDFGLADILQMIGIQRKTGVLMLEGGGERVTVRFLEGQVVGAETRDRDLEDLLGQVLVRTGRITDAQLQEALRIQKSSLQRLGYILVRQGFLSDDDLVDALRIQVSQIVYRLFRWRDGRYQFDPMDRMEYDAEHFQPLAVETILMEGARMTDEWPMIERRIKSATMVFAKTAAGVALDRPVASFVDPDLDLALLPDDAAPPDETGEIRLTTEERDVLHMVDGESTVQEMVDASPLGEFDVHRILFDLLSRHLVHEVRPATVIAGAADAETRRRWASATLQAGVFLLAALSVLTLRVNPYTPWRLAAGSSETELLRTYASRSRLARVDRALETYFLDRGSLPPALAALAAGRYLDPGDIVDPWGRPYAYRLEATGYEISGTGAGGAARDDLTLRHPFTPSQRMVLEGGTLDPARAEGR